MSDLPAGKWSELLVGNQWPGFDSLATLSAAATNRASIGETFEAYADMLRTIRHGPLGEQEGITADDTRQEFQSGEYSAQKISEVNLAKKTSYESARNATEELRSELRSIAEQGNTDIDQIVASKAPPPVKAGKIAVVVMKAQEQAGSKAASHSQTVLDAIQQVFSKSGIEIPARQFTEQHGVDLNNAFRPPSKDQILEQVRTTLNKTGLSQDSPPADLQTGRDTGALNGASSSLLKGEGNFSSTGRGSSPPGVSKPGAAAAGSGGTVNAVGTSHGEVSFGEIPTPSVDPYTQSLPNTGTAGGGGQQHFAASQAATNPSTVVSPQITTGTSTPGVSPAGSSPTTPNVSSLPSALPSTPTNALTPEGFAQNFNSGAQSGNPMSAGTEALSNTAAHAMQPQTPIHPESMAAPPMAPTAPTAGAPLFENAHATPTYEAAQGPTAPPADTTQAYVAGPAQAAPVMPSTAAPAAPQGPLPAYGADLRPPAATAPAGPPAMPTAAAPGSAPVHPSAGTQLNQPAVVRQAPTAAATAAPAPAGLTENAVAATTTGALAGASAAQTQAQQRLQRLLDAVARQEPKLRWAIGDREDGNTVLATDFASGWIPPHVDIPTGIKLLKPNHRSRTLDALLGETTQIAAYSPGQFIPATEDAEPVSMSIRARDTQDVDDLGWELSQATKWRDGLPRLAHTLAKAASTGTGYLDSEVELLREHLANVAQHVLTDYPDHVDAAMVGNWQLLATIDALIKGEQTAANYHFAWFQALNLALKGEVHR